MNSIIKIENLSKVYRLGVVGTGTLSHDLKRWYYKVRGWEDPFLKIGGSNDQIGESHSEYVWALKDINLEVTSGEILGVIGKNGAGKSTLLKILSRVTGPTTGSIRYNGHIGSLLEVGTGFHPELTGRENIFLNGAILGMTKVEIKRKLDEIISFSGVDNYIDTPVKRYSSGMMVRLGFAVAAHLEPEILIVDEVLAVGDAEFQKKALGKMKDVTNEEGRTVLFVSHNMGSILKLCNRAVLLNEGVIQFEGNTFDTVTKYFSTQINEQEYRTSGGKISSKAYFSNWYLESENECNSETILSGKVGYYKLKIISDMLMEDVIIGVALYDEIKRELIYAANSQDNKGKLLILRSGHNIISFYLRLPLKPGSYYFLFSINSITDGQIDLWEAQKKLIIITENQTNLDEKWQGILHEKIKFI